MIVKSKENLLHVENYNFQLYCLNPRKFKVEFDTQSNTARVQWN